MQQVLHSRRGIGLAVAAVLLLALVVVAFVLPNRGGDYRLQIVMPSAEGTFEDGKVLVGGQIAGRIDSLEVQDGKALVTVRLDEPFAPVHAGTTARISWKAVVRAKVLELLPGPATNPVLPSGSRVVSTIDRVEIDNVLQALDPPTRAHVSSLVKQLDRTLTPRQDELKATLASAGPTVEGLGQVLDAVGKDGPAIKRLVGQLRQVTETLDQRSAPLASTVSDLHALTRALAPRQQQLTEGLEKLPPTIDTAVDTLDAVPDAVDATVPLLKDLRPATAQLPEVAGNLRHVLGDLRPAVKDLKPVLQDLRPLLKKTPPLLDHAHAVLPGTTTLISDLRPALAFLRPYTPELAGWLSNWTSIFGSEGATGGNWGRALITASPSSYDGFPEGSPPPPGLMIKPRPAPGDLVNQPWTDANGDDVK